MGALAAACILALRRGAWNKMLRRLMLQSEKENLSDAGYVYSSTEALYLLECCAPLCGQSEIEAWRASNVSRG